jgi:hypothetical protein
MGCWNGTCMISNLPILDGEETKLVFLFSPHRDKITLSNTSGHHYATDFLKPAFFPITGTYNDYGVIEDIQKDWNYDLIINFLKSKYKSIQVEKKEIEDYTLEDIIRGIERGSLNLEEKDDILKPSPFSFVFIRKDIWDGIVASEKNKLYYWNDEKVSDDDYYVDAVTYYSRKINKTIDYLERIKQIGFNYYPSDMLFSIEEYLFNNQIYLDYILNNLDKNEPKEALIELNIIRAFLNHTRKAWMIQPGLGSQDSDIEPYILLHDLVKEATDKIKNYYND